MNETKNSADQTPLAVPSKTLTLKRPVEAGTVRQSFSHGRTKNVVVETVKRRAPLPGLGILGAPAARLAPLALQLVHEAAFVDGAAPAAPSLLAMVAAWVGAYRAVLAVGRNQYWGLSGDKRGAVETHNSAERAVAESCPAEHIPALVA